MREQISAFASPFARPGAHSFNRRRAALREQPSRRFRLLRALLIVFGTLCLGYYAYTATREFAYQKYENWVFDRHIAKPASITHGAAPTLIEGQVVGRISVQRLHLAAVVREGVSRKTLDVAVGHVPSTGLPGQPGNFAIAAHRDTLFRALKNIRIGDEIALETDSGTTFHYQVAATKVVQPSDVSVLQPDGGGLVADPGPLLTMITCYPFRYVGSAPQRFIVECKLIS